MNVPTEGLVAIGLLAAVALVAASAERRRRMASADPGPPASAEPPDLPLDEDIIGTIELATPSSARVDENAGDAGEGPSAEPPA
jgi:hypothetical protein